MRTAGTVLWGRGFRPFFLAAGIHAVVALVVWVAILRGALPQPPSPVGWHAHEMLFGFAAAAAAGFLLTSVPVWTGQPAVTGGRLAGLFGLWLLGRVGFALAGVLPPAWIVLLDLPFLPVLAWALALPLARARSVRNYGFPAIALALAAGNAAMHLEATGLVRGGAHAALRFGVYLFTLLIVIVGGRIVPLFTQNALQRAGVVARVRRSPWLDRASVTATLAVCLADLFAPRSVLSGAAAACAATILAMRAVGWQPQSTLRDPLLWSLHLGSLWVVIGFTCLAFADLGHWLPWTTALHALTAGAFGSMILAVMTRVALGHTGRPLVAPHPIVYAYALVTIGAAARMIGPLLAPGAQLALLSLSGLIWASAFALFVAVYAPILLRPRVDGAPG